MSQITAMANARLAADGKANDDRLDRALDEVYEAGLTPLFGRIAARAPAALDLAPRTGHMNTTSMSVQGKYNSDQDWIMHRSQRAAERNRHPRTPATEPN